MWSCKLKSHFSSVKQRPPLIESKWFVRNKTIRAANKCSLLFTRLSLSSLFLMLALYFCVCPLFLCFCIREPQTGYEQDNVFSQCLSLIRLWKAGKNTMYEVATWVIWACVFEGKRTLCYVFRKNTEKLNGEVENSKLFHATGTVGSLALIGH